MHKRQNIRGVYLLTREHEDDASLLAGVAAALRGGVRLVQYRDKSGDHARRAAQAAQLRQLTQSFAATLIINDDIALAQQVGADGVHLGAHDGDITAARRELGDEMLIGASCYDDLARADRAHAAGADYVAFGAFFTSSTKPEARSADVSLLTASRALGLPRVAIGGINAHNAPPLLAAGADAIAVLGAIWDAADRESAARTLCQLF